MKSFRFRSIGYGNDRVFFHTNPYATMSTFADVYISSLGCLCVLSTLCIISTHCIVSIPPTSLATVPLRRLAFYSSSPVMLVAFEVTKHVIAETEGGVTPRDVSFRNHVPYALV